MTLNTHLPDAAADDSAAEWSARLESEAAGLRADNAALRKQLTLRDQALDATPTFFVIAEQMAPEPIILYCNKVVADEHGLRRDELIGRGISTLTQWVSRDVNYVSDMNAALRAGRTFHHESEVARRDGSKFWLGVSIRPIFDGSGRVTHSVSMGADITAKREEVRKKQELQDKLVEEMKERARVVIELQLAQKLESVGRLAAGIAHEINTPIQYVGDGVYFLHSAYENFNQLFDGWRSAVDALPENPAHEPLRRMVGRIGKLPAMPKTYGRLQAALSQPTVTAGEVGDIVNADAAIASKVLQITNSAFFRLRKPMVRIKDAVTYLGFATIRNLVLSAEIFSQWKSPQNALRVDPEQLQNHAQLAAAACKSLAGGRASPDDAWLAGLLHDIGYWVLVQECPDELAQALELSRTQRLPLFECERLTTGATHAEIGAYLLGLWGLPYSIVEAVALHHAPTSVTSHGYDLLGALAVSHALLDASGAHGFIAPGCADPGVDTRYLANLNAPFDWDEAQRRIKASTSPTN